MNSYLKLIFIILIFLIFFLYLGRKVAGVFENPFIEIYEPRETEIKNSEILTRGRVKRVSSLEINGKPVLFSKQGYFEANLIFASGLNMIELKAKDKHSKVYTKKMMIKVNSN